MNYLVLKIAAGAFIGIVAAFLVYKGIDAWETKARIRRSMEEQRLRAEARRSRISESASKINTLTPDRLVVLCGPPLREHDFPTGWKRFMNYAGVDGHMVEIEFI